jgi:hypothetical protein
MKPLLTAAIFAQFLTLGMAQLPTTNVYLFSIQRTGDNFTFYTPRFLTGFNKYGYNNQPHFVSNNEIYLTVGLAGENGKTDVYSLSLLDNVKTQVTATGEPEYSPAVTPDRSFFSCVRVDRDNIQRLWKYPLNRASAGLPVFRTVQDIGYHCWLDNKNLALYMKRGSSNYLRIINTDTEAATDLTTNIGRSLVKLPNGKLGFIHKASEKEWYIKQMDVNSFGSEIIAQTLPGVEDFICLSDGTLIMGYSGKLYAYKPGGAQKEWREMVDLRAYGILNIKRLAVSREGDKIALVNDAN